MLISILGILISCSMLFSLEDNNIKKVDLKVFLELYKEFQKNDNYILIDFRTPNEYKSGRIEGAILLDFYRKDFNEELNKLDKNKTYLTYCRSGNRSGMAIKRMERMGFKNVFDLKNGIIEWKRNNLPLTK